MTRATRALISMLCLALLWNAPALAQGEPSEPTQAGEAPQEAPQPQGVIDAPPAQPAPGPLTGLHAAEIGEDLEHTPLGSLDPDAGQPMLIEFSRYGSGIESLRLTDYFTDITDTEHVQLQTFLTNGQVGFAPMSVESVMINGTSVLLQGVPDENNIERRMWRELAPGHFLARIVNAQGEGVLEIERRFELTPGSLDITVRQTVRNLLAMDLTVQVVTYGVGDLPQISGYAGDRRRFRYAYVLPESQDPAQRVHPDSELRMRRSVLGKATNGLYAPLAPYWPTPRAAREGWRLTWVAQSNRYFSVAVHPLDGHKVLDSAQTVDRVVINQTLAGRPAPMLGLRQTSVPITLAPAGSEGASASLDFGIYAGPLSKRVIRAESLAQDLALDELVVYNIGGMCAFCTFPWLTGPLTVLLTFLHDSILHDWALAIMFLVVIVRGILHPVTKWSQIRMQRFGKQMQAIAPKQKVLQERYKDDRKKLQQEMARLWKEEGISPTGMLGCLPMLMQSPIWIALYASLFYNFELRHDSAFFGIFQKIIPGWRFLGDLSEPDRFIYFGHKVFVPIYSNIAGPIDAINVLPILLGVVYFVHQKYLMPPTSAALTPEQEQQQKIMRVMFPIMFPFLMYNAPSGLSLYFITNSVLGILESRWIRAHIDRHDLLNIDKYKERRRRRPTLMQRLQKRIETQQRMKAMKKMQEEMPRPGMRQPPQKPRSTQPRYKRRDKR